MMLQLRSPSKFTATNSDESTQTFLKNGFDILNPNLIKTSSSLPQRSEIEAWDTTFLDQLRFVRYQANETVSERAHWVNSQIYQTCPRGVTRILVNTDILEELEISADNPTIVSKPEDAFVAILRDWIFQKLRTRSSLRVREREVSKLDASKDSGIKSVQARLVDLLRHEDDEDEVLKPTIYAFINAWELTESAAKLLGQSFPVASASVDDEGGIRLRWRSANRAREVRLYCPSNPTKKLYIYHEAGDKYDAIYNVSSSDLATWLSWLAK